MFVVRSTESSLHLSASTSASTLCYTLLSAEAFRCQSLSTARYWSARSHLAVFTSCGLPVRVIRVVRVPLIGGYATDGAYWGVGYRLYAASDVDTGEELAYYRASCKVDAKEYFRRNAPKTYHWHVM